MSYQQSVKMLKDKGLTVSHQRLAILDYMMKVKNHPTVDMIYNDLRNGTCPTLSRATVYNSLAAFVKAGLVTEVQIAGESELRYDVETHEHGHFNCRNCQKVFNIEFPQELIDMIDRQISDLEPQCYIENHSLHFSGLCPDCYKKLKNSEKTTEES